MARDSCVAVRVQIPLGRNPIKQPDFHPLFMKQFAGKVFCYGT